MGDPDDAVIRRIRAEEVEVYRAFRLRALQDTPEAFGDSYALAIARPESFWHERVAQMATSLNSVLLVAVDGATDAWLGMTGCYRKRHGDDEATVVSVWVVPEARRRHLARRLLDEIVTWARSHGVRTLRLWVTSTNRRAQRLYLGAGFAPTGGTQPLPSDPTFEEIEMSRPI